MQSRRLAGVVFWRTLSVDEIVMAKVREQGLTRYKPAVMKTQSQPEADAKAWLKIELLASDRGLKGHHIAKMMLGAALQLGLHRAGKDVSGPPRLVQSANGASQEAAALAGRLGFQGAGKKGRSTLAGQMKLSVVFDVEDRLRGLLCPRRHSLCSTSSSITSSMLACRITSFSQTQPSCK